MSSISLSRRGWLRVVGTVLILSGGAGCSSGKTQPVRGKVVFKDGTPATGGTVIFEPVDKKLQVSARGDIEPDGSFQLGTYTHDDGAPEGEYHALVVPPAPPEEKEERRPPRSPIPRKYLSPSTSPLHATVTRDRQKNNFTFELDRP